MAGHILLVGGAEFSGQMIVPDLRAIELAGGHDVPISIIPTAAAPDKSYYQHMSNSGVNWFHKLGAKNVEALPIVDRDSASDSELARRISQSRLIYLIGGFMGYLRRSLVDTACWRAVIAAYQSGAVVAGSSAGAMVLCSYFFDPAVRQITNGLELLPNTCVLPHHNIFGGGWVARLTKALPKIILLGIDERTGMLDDSSGVEQQCWSIYGQGAVTCYQDGVPTVYTDGQRLTDIFRKLV